MDGERGVLSGMVTEVREVQPENALFPMLFTLPSVGMTLLLQPWTSAPVAVSITQLPAL